MSESSAVPRGPGAGIEGGVAVGRPVPPSATGGDELIISDKTKRECQTLITQKLVTLVGENGVEILTEYVWHMITRPKATKEHVCAELDEFLGDQAPAFVDWVIAAVGPAINQEITESRQRAGVSAPAPSPAEAAVPVAPRPPSAATAAPPRTAAVPTGGPAPADVPGATGLAGRRILNMAVRQAAASSSGSIETLPPPATAAPATVAAPPHPGGGGRLRRVQMESPSGRLLQPDYPDASAVYRPARGTSTSPSGGAARRVSPYSRAAQRPRQPPLGEAPPTRPVPVGLRPGGPPPPPAPGAAQAPFGTPPTVQTGPTGGMSGGIVIDPTTGQALQLVPVGAGRGAEGVNGAKKTRKRCARFPQCPFGDECRYIHPSEMCLNWPHCTYVADCFYIHPEVPCKFGANCLNSYCNYVHPPDRDLETLQRRYNPYTGTFRNPTLVNTGGGAAKSERINEQAGSKLDKAEPTDQDDTAIGNQDASMEYGNQESLLGVIKADEDEQGTYGAEQHPQQQQQHGYEAPSTVAPAATQ